MSQHVCKQWKKTILICRLCCQFCFHSPYTITFHLRSTALSTTALTGNRNADNDQDICLLVRKHLQLCSWHLENSESVKIIYHYTGINIVIMWQVWRGFITHSLLLCSLPFPLSWSWWVGQVDDVCMRACACVGLTAPWETQTLSRLIYLNINTANQDIKTGTGHRDAHLHIHIPMCVPHMHTLTLCLCAQICMTTVLPCICLVLWFFIFFIFQAFRLA